MVKPKDFKIKRNRPKIFTEQCLTKLSPEIIEAIDFVVGNNMVEGKKSYRGRSHFIRCAVLNFLQKKLIDLGAVNKFGLFKL